MAKRVAVILGSVRGASGNGPAIAAWIAQRWKTLAPSVELEVIEPVSRFSLSFVSSEVIPAHQKQTYSDANVAAWSQYVQDISALIFVTPQHNWSIPASLKASLDVLYPEWKEKPVTFLTYGGHGGGRLAEHLKFILPSGYKMKLLGHNASLTLPGKNIAGTERLTVDEAAKIFANETESVDRMLAEVLTAVE